jgi:XTP/dITP diphosphohydrolase
MKLIFATHNANKAGEIRLLLPAGIELVSLADLGNLEEIEETADTLTGNALLKARCIGHKYSQNCFADDSGLEVEALGGAPGVHSARYAGPENNADNNIKKLLQALEGVENRKACFKTIIALIWNGREYTFEGQINGHITTERQGTQGFGYDPVFRPEGSQLTFAQMDLAKKNRISHRALAVNKLVDFLKQNNR